LKVSELDARDQSIERGLRVDATRWCKLTNVDAPANWGAAAVLP
jgi:hypothetical protein